MAIRNVAWFGTGNIGRAALDAVAACGRFKITLLARRDLEFTPPPNLIDALRGNDAVVVFTKFAPGSTPDKIQIPLIDAAIEAGVKLFVPSEWAPDTAGGNGATETCIGPATMGPNGVLGPKRATHNYLFGRATEGLISYALVYPGIIIEAVFKTGMLQFDFEKRVARLPDGGIHSFSTTSLRTLGKAIIGLLSEYPKTKNRLLYIADGITTQLDILKVAEEVTQQRWDKVSFPITETKIAAQGRIDEGTFGFREFGEVLTVPFFSGMTIWKELDNSLLKLAESETVHPEEEARRVVTKITKCA
ncbi:hypothetical protein N7449_007436 [Penicillium cf. viridicatum]|uniref:NmrA-like domain-containing protein n=1 Tax=Penicillium cf. viridicatum TaxID=2972119 RepID=A0A9W9ME70_9EURO|nr:hypothetical protein N7449_007436 [Penicillium cf. viridicatum]